MPRNEVTQDEIQIIKWGEKIIPGLIALILFALIMGAVNTRDVVAEISLKIEADDKREEKNNAIHEETSENLKAFNESQTKIKLQMNEFEIRQEYILEDVGAIKEQNQKILDILTGNGVNH